MNLFISYFVDYSGFLWWYVSLECTLSANKLKKNLQTTNKNIDAVRTMLSANGQKPNEAKVQQVYRQIKNQ